LSGIGLRGAIVGAFVALGGASLAGAQQGPPGGALYQKLCSQCHGEQGDGKGIAAPRLTPLPRDFTAAKFKVRTTPNGALPTDGDLLAVIRDGMPYTSMPGWSHLSDAQLQELVAAVKSFSSEFTDPARKPEAIAIPKAPKPSADSVAKGREVYVAIGCAACHGELGRGDGLSAPGLKDDWGRSIRPADLTKRWTFRGGAEREDIYRTFTTGMNGTPMPSFAESLSDDERWQLVDYIASLDPRDAPGYSELLQVQWSEEELDLARGAELFATAPPAYFSVVGQITEPGRAFHPSANGVTVRAVYNRREIAFLLTWHDMRADERGENAPDLPVPPEEDLGDPTLLAPAAAAEAEGGDFWGEAAAPEASAEDFWGEAEAPAAADDVGGDDFWGEAGDASPAAPTSGAEFSDAVAIQLPAQLPTGIRKPYFLFGDAQNPVDLWFVDLATKIARRYAAAGSTSVTAVEGEDVTAIASFDRGAWSVILKRSLKTSSGIAFAEAQYVPIAFSLWDGTARERGNKRGLTQWKYLYTMPRTTPSPAWPMLRTALAVLAVEIGLVWWVRRRTKRQHGEAESHV
jgi:mono/diheme cytochrome c family protein